VLAGEFLVRAVSIAGTDRVVLSVWVLGAAPVGVFNTITWDEEYQCWIGKLTTRTPETELPFGYERTAFCAEHYATLKKDALAVIAAALPSLDLDSVHIDGGDVLVSAEEYESLRVVA
jgi:hypothetical protein